MRWFAEDLCALRTHPSWIGTVKRSWDDIESHGWVARDSNTLFHQSVPRALRNAYITSNMPPRRYVLVDFNHRPDKSCLIHESHLVLLDRSFTFGDVVKRRPGDATSGIVIHTSVECTLQSTFRLIENPDLAYLPPSSPRPELTNGLDKESRTARTIFISPSAFPLSEGEGVPDGEYIRGVPAQELKPAGSFAEGRLIIYKDWVGMVKEEHEHVSLVLGNQTVVRVREPMDLEIPIHPQYFDGLFTERTPKVAEAERRQRKRLNRKLKPQTFPHNDVDISSFPPDRLAPGQHVMTSKENIRCGAWKRGAYDQSVVPSGYVVEVTTAALTVDWMLRNPNAPGTEPQPPPDLAIKELQRGGFRIYDGERMPSRPTAGGILPGYGYGTGIGQSEIVRFKNLEEAYEKYTGRSVLSEGQTNGKLTIVPSSVFQGYDLNTFVVIDTKTRVTVQWQDLTITTDDSTALLPYLNVDDLDAWPGELVSFKPEWAPSAPKPASEFSPKQMTHPLFLDASLNFGRDPEPSKPEKIGVVQSVDAGERVAHIKWFWDTDLGRARPTEILRDSVPSIGPPDAVEEEVSLYEIMSAPGLGMRLGDFVIVEPEDACDKPLDEEPKDGIQKPVDWLGQIVDLRLDGLVTVRLGALEEVQDLILPIKRVFVLLGADDYEGSEEEYSQDNQMDYEDDFPIDPMLDEEIIEESVEYEGGHRIDAEGGEEMWLTDDDTSPVASTTSHPNRDVFRSAQGNVDMDHENGVESITGPVRLAQPNAPARHELKEGATEALTNSLQIDHPHILRFSVLEGSPPSDHHHITRPQELSLDQIRRIWKEYRILETSLPDWVYVRTWESRLDLFRALIIGPLHTPYALAPFVVDFYFPSTFPTNPPEASFHSWTGGVGRINPNLYESGTVCLSILGTWPGEDGVEAWSAQRSSILQILVSLLGLVLVKEPYFNEAGFEALVGSEDCQMGSIQYNERAYILARAFVKHVLQYPVGGFEEEIRRLYLQQGRSIENKNGSKGPNLLRHIVQHVNDVVHRSENKEESGAERTHSLKNTATTTSSSSPLLTSSATNLLEAGGVMKVSRGAVVLLKRHLIALEKILAEDEAQAGVAVAAAAVAENGSGHKPQEGGA